MAFAKFHENQFRIDEENQNRRKSSDPASWFIVTACDLSLVYEYDYILKVTLKVINQDRMFFADFSVNCQQIFKKFCNDYILTES